MKKFNQFRKDIDEAAAVVTALPKIAGIATKVAPKLPKIAKFASGALKFGTAIPVGLGIANVLQSRGDGESNFDKLRKMREKGEGKDLEQKTKEDAKKPRTREKIQNALVDAGLRYRKGLSVRPEDVKGKKYRTDEMKGKSPADFVRELLKKQGREYKRQRIKNKKIDRDLGK